MAATGTYISQTDVENVFGTTNIADWSDLTGGGTADETRIQAGIDYAEDFVEGRFRSTRYQVPFVIASGGAYDKILVNWCAVMAGDWLYKARQIRRNTNENDRTSMLREMVENEIASALANQLRLNLAERSDPQPEVPACVY
jgi:phage gp36-like protein